MTFKTSTAAAFLLTASFLPMSAWAGVVFEVETTYHSGSPRVETSEMSVEKPNLKMEIASGREGSGKQQDTAIFRGDRREMVVINHEEQYYMVMDSASIARIGGQVSGAMDQAMKEINKHMEGLDPKQREMMEKMLKGNMPGGMPGTTPTPPKRAKSEYRKTGERANKKGYPCVKYEVLRGGEKTQELWVTDWSNVKGSQETAETFKEMAEFFEEMMDSIEDSMGDFGGGFSGFESDEIDVFAKIGGFPVVTRDFEGGELESETVLESVTERDLDPDAFEPPKGYRLRTMGPQ